jgi:hypothetical protein
MWTVRDSPTAELDVAVPIRGATVSSCTLMGIMAGDCRGTDLTSWWRNRAAYRKETAQTVAQLREAQSRLERAAGDAEALYFEGPPTEQPGELIENANTTLAALATARAQLPKLLAALESEKTSYSTVNSNVRAAAEQRTRAQAELAVRNEVQARRRGLERKQKLRKISRW